MSPFYEDLCKDLGWKLDEELLARMKEENEKKLKELDDSFEDAEKNQGEIEVRDTLLKKAEYYSSIGAKVCCSLLLLYAWECLQQNFIFLT